MEENFSVPKSAPIHEVVRWFWQVDKQHTNSLTETIIPKGIVEIIFNFENTQLHGHISTQSLTIPNCFMQGFHTCPVYLQLENKQSFFGVVLNPSAVKHIFGFPPLESANRVVDLTLIDHGFQSLWNNLANEDKFDDRINVFTKWLLDRLPQFTRRDCAFDGFLNSALTTDLSVTQAARKLCYSHKQLSRKLYELTGMNTERTLLYKKYLRAVHQIHYSKQSLTDIAYSCNFSDQSHFIKTFKSFTALTPGQYRQKKSYIMGHLLENVL